MVVVVVSGRPTRLTGEDKGMKQSLSAATADALLLDLCCPAVLVLVEVEAVSLRYSVRP